MITKEQISKAVDQILLDFPKEVEFYKQGKTVNGFFVGQTIKNFYGIANPHWVIEVVKEKLASIV
jgi:Asp-tRNA(Asn)/Glu-tRNA(Gln) amidotransferase B subunit